MWKITTLAAAMFASFALAAGDDASKSVCGKDGKPCPVAECCKDRKSCCHKKAQCKHCGKMVKITPVAKSADDSMPGVIAIIEEYSISEDIPASDAGKKAEQPAK